MGVKKGPFSSLLLLGQILEDQLSVEYLFLCCPHWVPDFSKEGHDLQLQCLCNVCAGWPLSVHTLINLNLKIKS